MNSVIILQITWTVQVQLFCIIDIIIIFSRSQQSVDLANIGGSAYVHFEPFGVVLDIGAWNYPIQIPFSTMTNIIAAGMISWTISLWRKLLQPSSAREYFIIPPRDIN